MSLYGRFFAAVYDRALAATEEAGLAERRATLLAQAGGRVLEVGAGTGLNLRYYGEAVTELVLCEPDPSMAAKLEQRVATAGGAARVVMAPAEGLPFADGEFDFVVATLVLCTVADLEGALAEARRVLAPGGRLLFCEHVRSPDPRVAHWQRRLTPLQRRVARGCHLDRDPVGAMAAAGFALEELELGRMPKAAPVLRPLAVGSAVADH